MANGRSEGKSVSPLTAATDAVLFSQLRRARILGPRTSEIYGEVVGPSLISCLRTTSSEEGTRASQLIGALNASGFSRFPTHSWACARSDLLTFQTNARMLKFGFRAEGFSSPKEICHAVKISDSRGGCR